MTIEEEQTLNLFREKLNKLSEKYNISIAERNSYFRYKVENNIIVYELPDMVHNEFMKEAIILAHVYSPLAKS